MQQTEQYEPLNMMARLLRNASSLGCLCFCNLSLRLYRKVLLGHTLNSPTFPPKEENPSQTSKKDLVLKYYQITASFGKGSIMWLGRSAPVKQVPVVSTGSFALDIAFGIGGLPKVILLNWILTPTMGLPEDIIN
ncbi:DNA repair protein recA homolog 3, mitochondrial-like isoform X4 [Coffea arabica]|uniref:DNA repair protein recA homolog 3, mitochondrial-like isoform X4 n=1 Tax=Coffea arabica TaxID=13443 RepID=A0ABM4WVG6_COFAR